MAHFEWRDQATLLLHCRVRANAKVDAFGSIHCTQTACSTPQAERIDVRIQAPPREGRANARLAKFFAEAFGVPRSSVTLIKGFSGRDKTVSIFKPKKFPTSAAIGSIHEQK